MASEANLLADVIQTHGREYFANKFALDKKKKREKTKSLEYLITEVELLNNNNIQNTKDPRKLSNISPIKHDVLDANKANNDIHKSNMSKLNPNYI